MAIIPIAILLGVFLFWTSMIARVHKEFKRGVRGRRPITLTFYTLGIAGVLIMLGRRGKSKELSHWVRQLSDGGPDQDEPPEQRRAAADRKRAMSQSGSEGRPTIADPDAAPPEGALEVAQSILQAAIREQATDIHVEPEPDQLKVRYRLDGLLETRGAYPPQMRTTVVSALKVMAGMDVSEKRRAQDGSFSTVFEGRSVDFRLSSVGTSHGEKIVIRILDGAVGLRKLQALGLSESMYQQVHAIVRSNNGMLVVCGPTGSGKTTTLYAALQEVDRSSLNVIAIENPIEYHLEEVSQHSINEKAGITFAGLLRTVLRQDPDILMVGEMRDKETAEIAMQAAMTGHFVYTTMHANDTVSAVFRLVDLGAPAYLIASSVRAILAQRLVRRLCASCKRKRRPTREELEQFQAAGVSGGPVRAVYDPKGCKKCRDTGYRGRVGVFELLAMNDEIRSVIQGTPSITDVKKAAEAGGLVHLRRDALSKAALGITSVEEAMRVTG